MDDRRKVMRIPHMTFGPYEPKSNDVLKYQVQNVFNSSWMFFYSFIYNTSLWYNPRCLYFTNELFL